MKYNIYYIYRKKDGILVWQNNDHGVLNLLSLKTKLSIDIKLNDNIIKCT